MKSIFSAAILLVLLAFGCKQGDNGNSGAIKLRFNSDGHFKIAQFTDLHWEDASPNSARTKEVILHILAAEQPDLAIVTGDVVTAPPAAEGWESIAKIFEEAKMPWALTLGNHDDEAGMTRSEVFEALSGAAYFVGEAGPTISGSGNYVLPIFASGADEVRALLYCLDTHNRPSAHKYGHYDWVHFDQLAWYREQSNRYTAENRNGPLPALAFFHIPIKEFEEIHQKENTFGTANEGVASSDINSGLFASFLEMQDVMGAFVGHDHNNDYIGMRYDIALAFGRTTGIDAYGDLQRGGRIIKLYEGERRFDTWVRTPSVKELVYYYPSGLSADEEDAMNYLLPKPVNNPSQGLRYRYYEGGRLKQLADTSRNAKLVHVGTTEHLSLDVATARDSFAIVFKGLIKIPSRGVYRFYTYSDDGSQLSIGGHLVVDNDGSHNARRKDGKVALEAGYHDFELAYFEDYMGEVLEVGYASRLISERVLPDSILFVP
ncbi:metallophosphoesterase [Parapedobacter soli]|uniref:metallophosphoesterase n=1 Tax=Parapedobacter soli TaxID=416955 RepID=UPI0021CA35FC|nr:metallophosphoesterase [Parapedobacter soli]